MIQIKVNHLYEVILLLLKDELHVRDITKKLNVSLTKIQAILLELRKYNVVDYKVEGKNHKYFLKKNLISRSYVLNAENYKLIKLLREFKFLEPLLREISIKYCNLMIVLFGSYAKFSPKEESDIDIYVETTDKNIKQEIEKINELVNVKIGIFRKNDLLIKEIIKNHILIQRGEQFYERLNFFEKT